MTELKLIKIEETARVAQEVQPGPYRHVAVRFMQHEVRCTQSDPIEGDQVALCGHSVIAEHIATCSPDVVLELVATIRSLQRKCDGVTCALCGESLTKCGCP